MVKINGQDCDKAGISVAEYLAAENYNVNHIVVEYNLTIIPKKSMVRPFLKMETKSKSSVLWVVDVYNFYELLKKRCNYIESIY